MRERKKGYLNLREFMWGALNPLTTVLCYPDEERIYDVKVHTVKMKKMQKNRKSMILFVLVRIV